MDAEISQRLVIEGRDGRSRWWLRPRSSHDGRGSIGPLVDPEAVQLWFGPDHERRRPDIWSVDGYTWPEPQPQRRTSRPLVVCEGHARGMTMRRDRPDAGTFPALIGELERLAALGVSVIELLPVHQFDPAEDNYWGYMPVVFGAVHQQYATDPARAPEELAALVAAAHEHDIEVWIDVVVNHTSEEDENGPLHHLRELGRRADGGHRHYVLDADGTFADEAGTGNTIDATSPDAQRLIMSALDRFADLGIDGYRFDLASVIARDPEFVRSIGDWGARRGVRLIAEPWDVVRYLVGRSWPDRRWMQWNDRFRDDMRGFLRGEPGLVPAVVRRLQGSPDLFDSPETTVNFLTAHDGFTMYDLVAYDRKHNGANGWGGADGPDENRSWNCGWEGDRGVPDHVMALRRRQLRNAWTLLALSHGTPMFVAGDEFARTQLGNNNAYRLDDETSWLDWDRRVDWLALETFVERLLAWRGRRAIFTQPGWWGADVEWFGAHGPPDLGGDSRSIAWHLDGLYAMANMWWEPLDFEIQAPGPWRRSIDTTLEAGFVRDPGRLGSTVRVGPRSIVVLSA